MPTIKLLKDKAKHNTTYSKDVKRHNKLYGKYYAAYREIRNAYIMDNPLDELELVEGRLVIAEHVHHLNPISLGIDDRDKMRLAVDYNNLIAVSRLTHNKIHNHPNELTDKQLEYLKERKKKIFENNGWYSKFF